MNRTVPVVAWEYGTPDTGGGSGFDWFFKKEHAEHAFETEKQNIDAFGGACYLVDVGIDSRDAKPDEVTEAVERHIWQMPDAREEALEVPWVNDSLTILQVYRAKEKEETHGASAG